tara:strand:+ start:1204 stop:2250 length:1047 start_codon:yes stop_codon:yes gene_type:complete
MQKKVLFTTLLFTVLGAGFLLSTSPKKSVVGFGTFSNYKVVSEQESVLPTEPTEIAFVGDVMLARNVERVQKKYGSDYIFQAMEPLSSTTVLVGNFESAVPKKHEPTPDMGMSFSTPTTSLPSLKAYGFAYMSLGNNHSYDKGSDNFLNTQKALQQNDLTPFGDQTVSSSTTTYVQLRDRTVALLGVSALSGIPDMQKLAKQIASASEQSDFQVAYLHWGTEYQLTHSDFQENFAQLLIDAGIDVVIGNHPHVVQDIQFYKGAPIFYSLGNFVFDQYFSTDVQEGLWVELYFEGDVPMYRLKPVTARGSYSQPRFMSAYDADRFLQTLAKRSDADYRVQIEKGVLTVQ